MQIGSKIHPKSTPERDPKKEQQNDRKRKQKGAEMDPPNHPKWPRGGTKDAQGRRKDGKGRKKGRSSKCRKKGRENGFSTVATGRRRDGPAVSAGLGFLPRGIQFVYRVGKRVGIYIGYKVGYKVGVYRPNTAADLTRPGPS